jgi:RNA polymerase sigma-70 factor (sigma-E family)
MGATRRTRPEPDAGRSVIPLVALDASTTAASRAAERAQGRDERWDALSTLFDLHYARLVATARFLLDDLETAEDVVMDAYATLHRRWKLLRDPNDAYRYLRSSVLNGSRSQLRRKYRWRLHDTSGLVDVPEQDDAASEGSDRVTLIVLLRRLPARQRQVLVMRFYLGMLESEVAEQLGISVGSVKQHSARGLGALAGFLEARDGTE